MGLPVPVRLRFVQVERRPEEVRAPGDPWPDVRRIVVARLDRLGDLVLSLPALAALGCAYPAARFALLVRPALAPLASLVEGVDEPLASADRGGPLVEQLARFAPDLAVCISRGPAVAWAVARARVPHSVGPGRRFYSPLFERRVAERRREGGRHEAEYALSFAHRAGAPPGPPRFPLRIPDAAAESAQGWLESAGVGSGFVVLHPGSGGSCPRWPVAHWLRLAGVLIDDGRSVVLSIGIGDPEVGAAFDAAPAPLRALPRVALGLPELAAVLQRAALVVSNSTGPLHLAAALGTPTLAFHAPWPTCGPTRWGPYAANGWALVPVLPEAATWSHRRRRAAALPLMAAIAPDVAASGIAALLAGGSPAQPCQG